MERRVDELETTVEDLERDNDIHIKRIRKHEDELFEQDARMKKLELLFAEVGE